MEIVSSPGAMTAWSNKMTRLGKTISFVPTMGCLHAGHLSLVAMARKSADICVLSLFVNPLQFGPNEDYEQYPRLFQEDCDNAESAGVDLLFAPSAADMYAEPFYTSLSVRHISADYCGASRPGHFDGVTTVVGKLFNIVKPHCAVFGAKDFQQLAVIRKMVEDLSWDIEILEHPIVRENDGLALSSRNRYLSPEERSRALELYRTIRYLQDLAQGNTTYGAEQLCKEGRQRLHKIQGIDLEYLVIVDKQTLEKVEQLSVDSHVLIAARIGQTRLIDNAPLLCS